MRLSALNRLRLAFAGIGVLLLVPLGLLSHSVTARLAAERRLRHEVVADRIFDELERELTRVLSQEVARPSDAYDSPATLDAAAPAYVLGYFTSRGQRTAGTDEKDRRVQWALGEVPGLAENVGAAPSPAATTGRFDVPPAPARAPQKNPAPAPRSSPEILKKLNRGDQTREEFGY